MKPSRKRFLYSIMFTSGEIMSVKLEDIARETGFSIPTVSRVLSNSNYPVSEQIREKVLQAANMMGYEPNIAARSLRTDRTDTIGIIVDDLLSPFTPPHFTWHTRLSERKRLPEPDRQFRLGSRPGAGRDQNIAQPARGWDYLC
jgi:hypothetical protein